ncbi:Uncharacterised protein [Achromobacter xylosoxidans]|nr:Uncharacterised protein [Achromobacter xylosoxidans]
MHAATAGGQHERLRHQLRQRHRRAARQRMRRRQHRHPVVLAQRTGGAAGRRIQHHAHVHGVRRQQVFDLAVAGLQRHHVDGRMQLPETPQHRRQDGREHHRETGQPQHPARRAGRLARQRLDAVERGEHGAGLVRDPQPQRGRHALAPFAGEQRRAQVVFELRDGLAGARLRHAHLPCRVRDVAGVHHRQQQPPVNQVHHGISPAYCMFMKK